MKCSFCSQVQNLSGGELQRVALALCLGKPADVYLIDEPRYVQFLGPRGPLIEPSMPARPPVRKKNPDHLYSLQPYKSLQDHRQSIKPYIL